MPDSSSPESVRIDQPLSSNGDPLSSPGRELEKKLESKTARIGILGLGYVGLPLAIEYAAEGFQTIGFDVDPDRVSVLNDGRSYIDDVDDERLRDVVAKNRFEATTDAEKAADVDVFFICVPTPVDEHKEPDTTYIESATETIADHLRPGQLVILKSTTYPETTERVVQPVLNDAAADKGLEIGDDYFLAFSPERIDPGNEEYTTANTPVVLGGVTDACTELGRRAMGQIVNRVHTVPNPKVAEMEKLLENIFRSVNIALVNEMAQLCDRMGEVSVWEVVEAAATKPFGFMPFYPGPGLGGHCIPIDPHYLSWLARRYDFETSFITLSARVNEEMPYYVTDAVVKALAEQPVRLSEAKVLVLGAAFKANVSDTRHSPAFEVIRQLRGKGVTQLSYSDPHVPEISVPTDDGEDLKMRSVELTDDVLRDQHVAIIVTGHDAFPYDRIVEHSRCVIDTRNALANVDGNRENVVVLGGGDFRTGRRASAMRSEHV